MSTSWQRVNLGRTGLGVTPLGLGSSFGIGARDVERACERGVNFLYWGSARRPGFGLGIRNVAKRRREDMVLVIQSYTRVAAAMRPSVELALRALGTDYTDILLLGWWNALPGPSIMDAASALVASGKARHIMLSCHHRPSFAAYAADPRIGAIMVRYNAAHPGAEREVFPALSDDRAVRPGVVAYTATRWGGLIDKRFTPAGERTPRASDCYRFALSAPKVDLVLSGPANSAELDEALSALDRGPMSEEELGWMRRVGERVRATAGGSRVDPRRMVDRVMSWFAERGP